MLQTLTISGGLTTFQQQVRKALILWVQNERAPITYEVLADLVRHETMLLHYFAGPLGAVSTDCHMRGEPLLSSIVVRQSGEPGPGFWTLVNSLYRITSPDKDRFLTGMQESVFRYWRP